MIQQTMSDECGRLDTKQNDFDVLFSHKDAPPLTTEKEGNLITWGESDYDIEKNQDVIMFSSPAAATTYPTAGINSPVNTFRPPRGSQTPSGGNADDFDFVRNRTNTMTVASLKSLKSGQTTQDPTTTKFFMNSFLSKTKNVKKFISSLKKKTTTHFISLVTPNVFTLIQDHSSDLNTFLRQRATRYNMESGRHSQANGESLIQTETIVIVLYQIGVYNREYSWFSYAILFKFIQFLKLFQKYSEHFDHNREKIIYTQSAQIFSQIFILAHISACIFITVAKSSQPNITWIDKLIDVTQIKNPTTSELYTTALYWSIITMVTLGYGDIVPISAQEKRFVIFVAFVSCGLFGYSFNLIGEIINESRRGKLRLKMDMENLNNLMEDRGLNHELKDKVRRYFAYLHQEKQKNVEAGSEMISRLPDSLKEEVMTDLYSKSLRQIPLLAMHFSDAFIQDLSLMVKEEKYAPELMILAKFQVPSRLSFLLNGEMVLYWDPKKSSTSTIAVQDTKGEAVGLQEFITQSPIEYYVKSEGVTSLGYFTYEDFLQKLSLHPKDYEIYFEMKQKIQTYREVKSYSLSCNFCKEDYHPIEECSLIRYQPNTTRIKFLQRESELITQVRCNDRSIIPRRYMYKQSARSLIPTNVDIAQEVINDIHVESLENDNTRNTKHFSRTLLNLHSQFSQEYQSFQSFKKMTTFAFDKEKDQMFSSEFERQQQHQQQSQQQQYYAQEQQIGFLETPQKNQINASGTSYSDIANALIGVKSNPAESSQTTTTTTQFTVENHAQNQLQHSHQTPPPLLSMRTAQFGIVRQPFSNSIGYNKPRFDLKDSISRAQQIQQHFEPIQEEESHNRFTNRKQGTSKTLIIDKYAAGQASLQSIPSARSDKKLNDGGEEEEDSSNQNTTNNQIIQYSQFPSNTYNPTLQSVTNIRGKRRLTFVAKPILAKPFQVKPDSNKQIEVEEFAANNGMQQQQQHQYLKRLSLASNNKDTIGGINSHQEFGNYFGGGGVGIGAASGVFAGNGIGTFAGVQFADETNEEFDEKGEIYGLPFMEIANFDKFKNFSFYFPHNNLRNLLRAFEEARNLVIETNRRSKSIKKSQEKQRTSKLASSTSVHIKKTGSVKNSPPL